MDLNRVDLTVNPSWSFIGKLFVAVAAIAFLLTAAIGVAQPMGWLDPLHEKVGRLKQAQRSAPQPQTPPQSSAPQGE